MHRYIETDRYTDLVFVQIMLLIHNKYNFILNIFLAEEWVKCKKTHWIYLSGIK